MNKKLLIFDFDGTLIDSVPDLAEATNAMLVQLNRPTYPLDTIKKWVGNGSRMLVERALSGHGQVDHRLTSDEVDNAERLFFEAYARHDVSKTIAYPDVDSGLKALKATGFMLALVTNKPIRFVPDILEGLGWTPLFDKVLGGDSLAVKKPDPAPLLHTCQHLNVNPVHAFMIGDSINDIIAGQRANIDTIGVSYGYNYGKDIRESHPTHAFDSFADLLSYLRKVKIEPTTP